MNTYIITYKDGTIKEVQARKAIEVVKEYNLATKENISTTLTQK